MKLKRPSIPERVSSKIPVVLHQQITETQQRKVSHASQLSNFSVARSSVSDFLEEKIKSYEYDLEYLSAQINGLQGARDAKMLDGKEYDIEALPFLEQQSHISQELTLLLNQQKIISEDMEDEIKRRPNIDEPEIQFFERAYAATIVPKVMSATAHQKKRRFDANRFKKAVLNAYNAARVEDGAQLAWCHVSQTWYQSSLVKAAHLVPKSLNPREVAYLFGIKEASEDFFYDWRLG